MTISSGSLDAGQQTYHPFGTFRLALALLVVISHARGMGGPSIESALEPWGVGNIGVMAFFVISGFIITEAIHRFYWGRIDAFLSNRLLRLLPPYFFALLLSVAIHAAFKLGPPHAFDLANLSVQPLLPLIPAPPANSYSFVRYIWAVEVEFYFYLIYAALIVAYCHFRPTAAVAATIIGLLILAAVPAHFSGRRTLWIFAMLPYFAAGAFLYWLALERASLAVYGLILSAVLSTHHFLSYTGKTLHSIGALAVLLGLCCLIIPLWSTRISASWKVFDQRLGDLSYPLYLNHFAIVTAFYALWPSRGPGSIMISIAASIAVSWIATVIVEPLTRSARDRRRGTQL